MCLHVHTERNVTLTQCTCLQWMYYAHARVIRKPLFVKAGALLNLFIQQLEMQLVCQLGDIGSLLTIVGTLNLSKVSVVTVTN